MKSDEGTEPSSSSDFPFGKRTQRARKQSGEKTMKKNIREVAHEFLNEPEMIKIVDYIEAGIALTTIFGFSGSFLITRIGFPKIADLIMVISIVSLVAFGSLFFLRRPINR